MLNSEDHCSVCILLISLPFVLFSRCFTLPAQVSLFGKSQFCFQFASLSWRASAGGKVLPQEPWKWNLQPEGKITDGQVSLWLMYMNEQKAWDLCQGQNKNLLEALSSWSVLQVEFSDRDTSGCHLRSKHGCWIHDWRGANLGEQFTESTYKKRLCGQFYILK